MLIEAGLACLARGGIKGFTIDRICAEAKVSRGLAIHHFGSKDGLLAAIYETMMAKLLAAVETPIRRTGERPEARILAIVEASFGLESLARGTLRIWLALWGEIATNPELLKAHRKQYARYRAGVESALAALADGRKLDVDIPFAATMFISLVDGLWLEWCIDRKQLSASDARKACLRLLEPIFGKVA